MQKPNIETNNKNIWEDFSLAPFDLQEHEPKEVIRKQAAQGDVPYNESPRVTQEET